VAFAHNPELEQLAAQAAAAVNLDIAGVDLLFGGSGYSVCEVGPQALRGLRLPLGST